MTYIIYIMNDWKKCIMTYIMIYIYIYVFVYDITGPIDDSSYDPMSIFYLRNDEILFGWQYLRHSLRHYVIVSLLRSTRHFDTFSSRHSAYMGICNYAIEFIIRLIEHECIYYICNYV